MTKELSHLTIPLLNKVKTNTKYLPKESRKYFQQHIILMCNAFSHTTTIVDVLAEANLEVDKRLMYYDFIDYANKIYMTDSSADEEYLWLANLYLEFPNTANQFQVWFLKSGQLEDNLTISLKKNIRNSLGSSSKNVFFNEEVYSIQYHFVHIPDSKFRDYELSLLSNYSYEDLSNRDYQE